MQPPFEFSKSEVGWNETKYLLTWNKKLSHKGPIWSWEVLIVNVLQTPRKIKGCSSDNQTSNAANWDCLPLTWYITIFNWFFRFSQQYTAPVPERVTKRVIGVLEIKGSSVIIVCEDGAKLTVMSENLKQKLALDDLTEDSVIDKALSWWAARWAGLSWIL